MIKKARIIFRKLRPLAFLLLTLVTTQMSATKQVIARSME